LAGNTPEEAVDAFLDLIRTTLACITDGTAIGSGTAVGQAHVLTLWAPGQQTSNVARLPTYEGVGEVLLRFAHEYTVVPVPEDQQRGPYKVHSSSYQYRILDIKERELVIHDWHPQGMSPVLTPHVHVPPAGAVIMAQRPGSPREGAKTYLGDLHIPTARIFLEDVVEFLIRDFDVVTLKPNWRTLLERNRAAIERDRTW
jgi:hypothetical protein